MTHAPIKPNSDFPETANIERYEPAIYVPNLDKLNKIRQPLISPNIEVNRALETEDSPLEDYVVTWYFDAQGNQYEILIGETIAGAITNPIFLLDHASAKTKGKVNTYSNKSQVSCSGDIRFDSKEVKINEGYRYETGLSRSEYSIVGYRMKSDGTNPEWVYDASGWKKIGEIKKSEIGSTKTFQTLHACQWLPYTDNKFYWNTFERDWNRSQKDLGSASYGGKTIYLGGNMRYDGDWYAYIPSTVNIHNTPFDWFGWEIYVNFYSWKADYIVYDVQN